MTESLHDPLPRAQCADAVLMIRPASFDYNPETAATNSMMRRPGVIGATAHNDLARAEFQHMVNALRGEGISVCVADDTPQPPKPDAIFPNNWVSFHADGTVVLYPMHAENRRTERRQDVVDAAAEQAGFKITRVLDLSPHERQGRCLEGTGSLVLDHTNRVAYASVSPRTHPAVVDEWARELGYTPIVFRALDRAGAPVYHTNVLMCLGERFALVGTEAIAPNDRAAVLEQLRAGDREIVEIGHDEIERFAGNMLELATWDEALGDSRVLVMSTSARDALTPDAYGRLSACTDTLLVVPVPTIEKLSGGSVRCMLAEIFLPT
ncbi:MAG: arginine deiminase-related protein [Gammaproteobacteria bacterium]